MIYVWGEKITSLPKGCKKLFSDHLYSGDKFTVYEKQIDKEDNDLFFSKYGKHLNPQYYTKDFNTGLVRLVQLGKDY